MDFVLGCVVTVIFFIILAKIQESENCKTNIGRARNEISDYENSGNIKHLIEAREQLEKEILRTK